MDILLTQAAVLNLMTSRRAGAIVFDGPTDLNLWRPPGPERSFAEAYGPQRSDALDKERRRLEGRALALGELLRLHPGKLHCEFVIWVATRPPHDATTQSAAPSLEVVSAAVRSALDYAAERNVVRIAFGPLGAGPGEVDAAERLAAIVRAAHEYKEACTSTGRGLAIEEVQVCHPSSAVITQAQRMVQRMAKAARPESTTTKTQPATPVRKKAAKPRASTRTPRGPAKLTQDEISHARSAAPPYDANIFYMYASYRF
jgi:O-acetyl-ADP-ribose deacetylase (regulator of RNase III)